MQIVLTADEEHTLRRILTIKGRPYQQSILAEEAAEMIAAITHEWRGRERGAAEFIEEAADVLVCLCQFWILHEQEIAFDFSRKIKRLKERMEKQENEL